MSDISSRRMRRSPEAAAYIGVAEPTLRKWRLEPGRGPRFIKAGRTVIYHPDDLDAWLNANRRTSTSAAA